MVAELRSATRALPIIVVSQNEGETLWPRLAENLAYDLAGLVHVVAVDDEATWALTDALGKLQSCYRGAVRLYWPAPRQDVGEKLLNSTVWTSSNLLSNDRDGRGMDRFRTTLRRMVMSIAAMTITPPVAIREIQAAVARKRLEDVEARSTSNTEELEIARLYLSDNEELKIQLEHASEEIARLSGRAEAAEFVLGQVKVRADGEEPPEAEPEADAPLTTGETRFYKKTHSKQAYDVMVPVSDCGHTSWQGSAKADKAKKGVEKLEGRSDWKSLQHCGTCTGGGMWKVKW